jgi:hypothetical protein
MFYGVLVANVAVVVSRLWEASAREATLRAHLETVLWPRPYGNEYTVAHRRVKLATLWRKNKLREGPRVGLQLRDGRPAVIGKAFVSGCVCQNLIGGHPIAVGRSECVWPVPRQVMVFFLFGGFLEVVGGVRIRFYRRTIARIRQTQAIDDGRPAADGLDEAAGDAGWAVVASLGVLMNGARSYLDEDNARIDLSHFE